MLKFPLFIILLLSINSSYGGVNQLAGNEQDNPFVDFEVAERNTKEVSWPVSLESMMEAIIDLSTEDKGVKYVGNYLFRMDLWKQKGNTIPQEKASYLKSLLSKEKRSKTEERHYRELESFSKKIKTTIDFLLVSLLKDHSNEKDSIEGLQTCYTDLYQEVFDCKPCSMDLKERSGDTSRCIAVSAGAGRYSLYLSGINKDDNPFIFDPGLTIFTLGYPEGKAKAFNNIREIIKPLLENNISDDKTQENDLQAKSCCHCGYLLKCIKGAGKRIYNRKAHSYSSS